MSRLHAESGIPPLTYRRNYLGISYLSKIIANTNHPAHPLWVELTSNTDPFTKTGNSKKSSFLFRALNEMQTLENIEEIEEIESQFFSSEPPWTIENVKIDSTLTRLKRHETSEEKYKSEFEKLLKNNLRYANNPDREIFLYTDGSKSDDATSYAVVGENLEFGARLPNTTSIFTAEMMAILKAVEHAGQKKYRKCNIVSDSLSALKSLEKIFTNDQMTIKIKDKIQKFPETKFKIIWCPSHQNIGGNERADQAAKRFSENNVIEMLPITLKDFKNKARTHYKEKFKNYWRSIDPEVNKLKRVRNDLKKYVELEKLNRKDSIKITRLRLGHTRKTHRYLMNRETPNVCDCGSTLTVEHIMIDCPKYMRTRNSLNIESLNILSQDNVESYEKIIKFLKQTKIYEEI